MVTGMACTAVPNMATSGPGPSLAVPEASTRMEISLSSFSNWARHSVTRAVRDHQFGQDAGQIVHHLGGIMQQRLRPRHGLRRS